MKGFLIFALFLLAQQIKAATMNCEKTPLLFNERLGRIRSCFLADVTAIDSPGFEIAERNEQIYALYFESNTKIHFLPVKVHEKFPNLLLFTSSSCSLTEISKPNFEKMAQLEFLYLESNKIEKIVSNTFEDLTALKEIDLSKNCSLFFLYFL